MKSKILDNPCPTFLIDKPMKKKIIDQLIKKGVSIPNPESVYVSDDVDPDRISGDGVTLYSGTKLIGKRTLVLPGVRLGYEAPVTLENTLVGANSQINGGFFQGSVFLGDNVFGSGGHVRAGTILEEEANAAHTVGLKQTILFPFVTLGSLINFCDCFMAGGTNRKNHSEVGSSFIHFNYTPNQDKATPSMLGNVHQGVMLNQAPVFLGGQGGLVGPVRLEFGSMTAAGSVIRKNEEKPNRLILGGGLKNASIARRSGVYTQVATTLNNNIIYIAGLISLRAWYHHVRPLFTRDCFTIELIEGLKENIDLCIGERIKQLMVFQDKLKFSRKILLDGKTGQGNPLIETHDKSIAVLDRAHGLFKDQLAIDPVTKEADLFLNAVETGIKENGKNYIQVIQGLSPEIMTTGSKWLLGIEKKITDPLQS